MIRPPATVSVDLDPVNVHLEGYGVRGLAPDERVWTRALPRLRERFARHRIRATFFVVARDAPARAAELRALAAEGHEVASHSLTHPLPFARLPAARRRVEIEESKRRLEEAGAGAVVGFRAPHFDADRRVLAELAAAGYRYDASGYPTPLLMAARLALAVQGAPAPAVLALRWRPLSLERGPHRVSTAAGGLLEFPLSVTPGLRLPVYHTLRFLTAPAAFARRLEGFAARGEPLAYVLHAVDALGLREDGVDPRLRRHPGMAVPLEAKLGALDDVLARIAASFEPLPFRDRLG